MTYVFDQFGTYGFAVEDLSDIKAEILHATCADTGNEFYLVELKKLHWAPNAPDEMPSRIPMKAAIYRTKTEAGDELVRLGRLIKWTKEELRAPDELSSFQFKKSDITPLEITNLKTAFI